MSKLTKRAIEALKPATKEYFIWEQELSGFGTRVFPTGRIQFVFQYRYGRKSRRMNLGRFGALSVEQARKLAFDAIAKLYRDIDPQAEKEERRDALTVNDLAVRFEEEHIAVHLKATTAKQYRRNLKLLILPALGRSRIADVTRVDVARFHHEGRRTPYQANRNLEIISKMFNLAEMWGLRPDGTNPRRHIRKYSETKRERYYSSDELRAIGRTLCEMEAEHIELPSAIAAVRLLLFTGCRLNEVMTLQWQHVDLLNFALRLPESKTGTKVVNLGQAAVAVIEQIEKIDGNPYVITGCIPKQHLSDLQPFWQRVRARAGLKDARLHDLRHTFASIAVCNGKSLPMIGKLLGHSQVQTTARYAHLARDPVIEAANDITGILETMLSFQVPSPAS